MAAGILSELSIAETGALALAGAACALDRAADTRTFLGALECNRRVWRSLGRLAMAGSWPVPDAKVVAYALKTSGQSSGAPGRDDDIHALIDINRRVSASLAGGKDLERIRDRARAIWEGRGRPVGEDLDHWLLAEMEVSAG